MPTPLSGPRDEDSRAPSFVCSPPVRKRLCVPLTPPPNPPPGSHSCGLFLGKRSLDTASTPVFSLWDPGASARVFSWRLAGVLRYTCSPRVSSVPGSSPAQSVLLAFPRSLDSLSLDSPTGDVGPRHTHRRLRGFERAEL